MIITGEKAYLKSYDSKLHNESKLQNEINNSTKIQNEEIKNTKVTRKESKTSNNDIYKNIKNKASILKQDQRHIQEKISTIQIQEQKVYEMENTLKQVKQIYQQAIESGNQEGVKQKIKIRKIEKEVNSLNNEYNRDQEYLQDDKHILAIVKEALKNINNIKGELAQCKAKLFVLENDINTNKKQVEYQENMIEKYIQSEEYVNEKIIINPLDFISIEGDISSNIVINILV